MVELRITSGPLSFISDPSFVRRVHEWNGRGSDKRSGAERSGAERSGAERAKDLLNICGAESRRPRAGTEPKRLNYCLLKIRDLVIL